MLGAAEQARLLRDETFSPRHGCVHSEDVLLFGRVNGFLFRNGRVDDLPLSLVKLGFIWYPKTGSGGASGNSSTVEKELVLVLLLYSSVTI
jgi:hypothetical protein